MIIAGDMEEGITNQEGGATNMNRDGTAGGTRISAGGSLNKDRLKENIEMGVQHHKHRIAHQNMNIEMYHMIILDRNN